DRLLLQFRAHVGDYLLAALQGPGATDQGSGNVEASAPAGGLNPLVLQKWQHFLQETPALHRPIFRPWLEAASHQPPAVSQDKGGAAALQILAAGKDRPALTDSRQPAADSPFN